MTQTGTKEEQHIADDKQRIPKQHPSKFIKRLKANSGFLFILPAVAIFLLFGLYTVIYSFVLSLFRWNGFGGFSVLPPVCKYPACQFIGLENYTEFLYQNPTMSYLFWQSMQNTLLMTAGVTIGCVLIALPLAMALNKALIGQSFFRTLIILPMVTAGIAVFYVWMFIYRSDGLLNNMLNTVGLGFLRVENGWLGDPKTALFALIVVMVWGGVPMAVLLYLTGLQTINRDLYDAADIDGANGWQRLRHITWPLLQPITVIIVILNISSTLQGSYEIVYLMTNGGPAGHTAVVGLQIFNYGFGDQRNLGVASAMSWFLFIIVFTISLLNLRMFRSND